MPIKDVLHLIDEAHPVQLSVVEFGHQIEENPGPKNDYRSFETSCGLLIGSRKRAIDMSLRVSQTQVPLVLLAREKWRPYCNDGVRVSLRIDHSQPRDALRALGDASTTPPPPPLSSLLRLRRPSFLSSLGAFQVPARIASGTTADVIKIIPLRWPTPQVRATSINIKAYHARRPR